MKKVLLVVIVLVLAVALAVVLFVRREGVTPGPAVSAQNLAADAYPLYPEFTWGQETRAVQEGMAGYQANSAATTSVTDISAISQPFEDYYEHKLAAAGWTLDNALAAGGPGAAISGYQKGSSTILFGYQSAFGTLKPDEPAQCPCDVTFFVFSSDSAQ